MRTSLLPEITDGERYRILFKENEIWEPAIQYIVQKHQLRSPAVRGTKGSHIVYRAGDIWIKLMAPIYAEDMPFELAGLRAVEGQMEFFTPRVVAEGEIESWPYVLISHVEGERVGDYFDQLSTTEQVELAIEFARATKSLQKVFMPQVIRKRSDWNQFIQKQYYGIVEHHRSRNMPDIWLKSLVKFVHQFPISDFTVKEPVFLHSDLTWDHFLIKKTKGQWRLSGIIDFADAQAGHSEYDMCAPMAFLFRGKPEVLSQYSREMGVFEQQKKLSHKLLTWTLLHRFSNLKNYFAQEMIDQPDGDFGRLAEIVYPIK